MKGRTLIHASGVTALLALLFAGSGAFARAATGTDADGTGQAHADAQSRGALVAAAAPSGYPVQGIDVSHYQGTINWATVASAGIRFTYAKATEGTSYVDPTLGSNLSGAKSHGIYAGAYHFGRPDLGAPVTQADHFIAHASFARDGHTLPPMLDIETGTTVGQATCYGLSTSAMVSWINSFVNEVKARTGSVTTIYTAASFWNQCTGGTSSLHANPLFVARWSSVPTPLPTGWSTWTFWQYTDAASLAGVSGNVDGDVFNGTLAQLAELAGAKGGTDTYGYYNPADRSFHLKNNFDPTTPSDIAFATGWTSDVVPLLGDWDGNGTDTYGYYNPADRSFHLKNNFDPTTPSDIAFATGWTSDVQPLVGDWDGN